MHDNIEIYVRLIFSQAVVLLLAGGFQCQSVSVLPVERRRRRRLDEEFLSICRTIDMYWEDINQTLGRDSNIEALGEQLCS